MTNEKRFWHADAEYAYWVRSTKTLIYLQPCNVRGEALKYTPFAISAKTKRARGTFAKETWYPTTLDEMATIQKAWDARLAKLKEARAAQEAQEAAKLAAGIEAMREADAAAVLIETQPVMMYKTRYTSPTTGHHAIIATVTRAPDSMQWRQADPEAHPLYEIEVHMWGKRWPGTSEPSHTATRIYAHHLLEALGKLKADRYLD